METIKSGVQSIDSKILADYVLEQKGSMSHLKLQKLLYLIEGYHLAYFQESLIDDDFEAWVHGPVSRKIYDSFKGKAVLYGDVCYDPPHGAESRVDVLGNILTYGQMEIIDEVLDLYGNDSGLVLESITHSQEPWINARKGVPQGDRCDKSISKNEMKAYFMQFL